MEIEHSTVYTTAYWKYYIATWVVKFSSSHGITARKTVQDVRLAEGSDGRDGQICSGIGRWLHRPIPRVTP